MNIPSDEQLMSVFAAKVEKSAGLGNTVKKGMSKAEKALSRQIGAASRQATKAESKAASQAQKASKAAAPPTPPAAATTTTPPTPPAAVKPGRKGGVKSEKAETRLKDNRIITNEQRKSALERSGFGRFLDNNFITGGKKRSTLASKAQTITKAQLSDTTPAGKKALAKQLAANEALKKYDRNLAIKRAVGLGGLGAGTLGIGGAGGFALGNM